MLVSSNLQCIFYLRNLVKFKGVIGSFPYDRFLWMKRNMRVEFYFNHTQVSHYKKPLILNVLLTPLSKSNIKRNIYFYCSFLSLLWKQFTVCAVVVFKDVANKFKYSQLELFKSSDILVLLLTRCTIENNVTRNTG